MTCEAKFDYLRFSSEVDKVSGIYNKQKPFPFAYFDDLFSKELLDNVNKEIEDDTFEKDIRDIDGVEIKTRSKFDDTESVPEAIRMVLDVINGGKFLKIVSTLTGIDGLISDPYHDGGGVNIIENGGTLAVHVDGTTQHRMQLCRRINAILFLNDYWDESWNGYHEHWDYLDKSRSPFDKTQNWKCVRKILPKKNRLIIFTTNDHSWHGHAGVLNIPEGVKRKSLILYFYTVNRPREDVVFNEPHRALFINNSLTLKDGAFENVEVIL